MQTGTQEIGLAQLRGVAGSAAFTSIAIQKRMNRVCAPKQATIGEFRRYHAHEVARAAQRGSEGLRRVAEQRCSLLGGVFFVVVARLSCRLVVRLHT